MTPAKLPAPIADHAPRLPSPASAQAVVRMGRLSRAIRYEPGRGWIIDQREALVADERGRFDLRAKRIRAALAPAGEAMARQAMARLSAALRPRALAGPAAMAELGATESLRVLAALPAGPLADVTDRFIDGRLGGRGFAPEAAEVAQATRETAAAWGSEAGLLERALLAIPDKRGDPEPLAPGETPEERAARRKAVAEQVRMTARANAAALARADGRARGEAGPPGPETPDDALARLATAPPVSLSADALRRLHG